MQPILGANVQIVEIAIEPLGKVILAGSDQTYIKIYLVSGNARAIRALKGWLASEAHVLR